MQSVLLVLLQSWFKKAGIQLKRNNVLRNEDEKYQTLKVFHPALEHTVKSNPFYEYQMNDFTNRQ